MQLLDEQQVSPSAMSPIRVSFYFETKKFYFSDGIHRTEVFHDRKYPFINSELTTYWSFASSDPPVSSLGVRLAFLESLRERFNIGTQYKT
jgi:hypothetical protein